MKKVSDNNFHKFGFQNDGFIHYSKEELDDKEIEGEFSEDFQQTTLSKKTYSQSFYR